MLLGENVEKFNQENIALKNEILNVRGEQQPLCLSH